MRRTSAGFVLVVALALAAPSGAEAQQTKAVGIGTDWCVLVTPALAAFLGLLVTIFLGLFVKRAVHHVKPTLVPPPGLSLDPWRKAILIAEKQPGVAEGQPGTRLLGVLEQVSFFFALFLDAALLIPGWLAFKLASKWYGWQHIVRFPEIDRTTGPRAVTQELHARNALGTLVVTRFLVGSLYNVVCAVFGVLSTRAFIEWSRVWPCWWLSRGWRMDSAMTATEIVAIGAIAGVVAFALKSIREIASAWRRHGAQTQEWPPCYACSGRGEKGPQEPVCRMCKGSGRLFPGNTWRARKTIRSFFLSS